MSTNMMNTTNRGPGIPDLDDCERTFSCEACGGPDDTLCRCAQGAEEFDDWPRDLGGEAVS